MGTQREYSRWAQNARDAYDLWFARRHVDLQRVCKLKLAAALRYEMLERVKRTVSLFEREAKKRPRVLALGLHPHLIGVPHRFGSLEKMLDLLMKTPDVCFLQGHDIADWYTAQVPAPRS